MAHDHCKHVVSIVHLRHDLLLVSVGRQALLVLCHLYLDEDPKGLRRKASIVVECSCNLVREDIELLEDLVDLVFLLLYLVLIDQTKLSVHLQQALL